MKMEDRRAFMEDLRGDPLAMVLSHTSPLDACRLSLVSSDFEFAAKYDLVWESFMPSDYHQIIRQAAEDSGFLSRFSSKKQLYLHLCDHPLIIDGGKKSFSLDKETGKKCYMLAARDLGIAWGDTPNYWVWRPSPNLRFAEVAELVHVWWFAVEGRISTSMLSPDTVYVAFLVFRLTPQTYGFKNLPVEVSIGINELESQTGTVIFTSDHYLNLNPNTNQTELVNPGTNGIEPRERKDGWMEIELGEYLNTWFEGELKMSLKETRDRKGGIVIQGIEIRPKSSKS